MPRRRSSPFLDPPPPVVSAPPISDNGGEFSPGNPASAPPVPPRTYPPRKLVAVGADPSGPRRFAHDIDDSAGTPWEWFEIRDLFEKELSGYPQYKARAAWQIMKKMLKTGTRPRDAAFTYQNRLEITQLHSEDTDLRQAILERWGDGVYDAIPWYHGRKAPGVPALRNIRIGDVDRFDPDSPSFAGWAELRKEMAERAGITIPPTAVSNPTGDRRVVGINRAGSVMEEAPLPPGISEATRGQIIAARISSAEAVGARIIEEEKTRARREEIRAERIRERMREEEMDGTFDTSPAPAADPRMLALEKELEALRAERTAQARREEIQNIIAPMQSALSELRMALSIGGGKSSQNELSVASLIAPVSEAMSRLVSVIGQEKPAPLPAKPSSLEKATEALLANMLTRQADPMEQMKTAMDIVRQTRELTAPEEKSHEAAAPEGIIAQLMPVLQTAVEGLQNYLVAKTAAAQNGAVSPEDRDRIYAEIEFLKKEVPKALHNAVSSVMEERRGGKTLPRPAAAPAPNISPPGNSAAIKAVTDAVMADAKTRMANPNSGVSWDKVALSAFTPQELTAAAAINPDDPAAVRAWIQSLLAPYARPAQVQQILQIFDAVAPFRDVMRVGLTILRRQVPSTASPVPAAPAETPAPPPVSTPPAPVPPPPSPPVANTAFPDAAAATVAAPETTEPGVVPGAE